MKAALVTPFLKHLPLHPGVFLGVGAAVLEQRLDLDIIDLNAEIYYRNRHLVEAFQTQADGKQVFFDDLDLDPLYHELLNKVEDEYREVSWDAYPSVFITTPSWFVTVPTENILRLVRIIKAESPSSALFFFGNSLGTWTDEDELKQNGVQIVHLNDLFRSGAVNEPVDYDSLPTPVYRNRDKYLFDMLPFRLKHGCTWGKCRFCSLAKGWNSGYRERSSERVFQEIRVLDETYDPIMFVCKDNSVNGNNLMEFCGMMKGLEKPWAALARADLGDGEIRALSRANCRLLYFGLESGNDRVLQEINKGIRVEQISAFIKNLRGNDMIPAPSLFVGTPGEREDDFELTLQFLAQHRDYLDTLNVYPLAMTPGSDFANEGRVPHPDVLHARLLRLIVACSQLGIGVYVGEQGGEYIFAKQVYPGRPGY